MLIEEIDRVFAENPSFIDHRKLFPWVTAFLGNPESKTIFLAENPSLPQMKRAAAEPTMRSEETQWNVSSGDKIFRQALVGSGFKEVLDTRHDETVVFSVEREYAVKDVQSRLSPRIVILLVWRFEVRQLLHKQFDGTPFLIAL